MLALRAGGLLSPTPPRPSAAARQPPPGSLVFVVNPAGGNGRVLRKWKDLLPALKERLAPGQEMREAYTTHPFHAVELAKQAVQAGAGAVVAVGGDGTLHEVLNGFFEGGQRVQHQGPPASSTSLGLIPLGTGSDFAKSMDWSNDPVDAVNRIVRGDTKLMDVGRLQSPQTSADRYFLNILDMHLSAKAGQLAAKYKSWGQLCYVIGTLLAFSKHKDVKLRLKIDEGDWQILDKLTMIAIANARFFGGGMCIAPMASPSSGSLDAVILQDFKWHDFLLHAAKLYKGTHTTLRGVSCRRLEIRQEEGSEEAMEVWLEADGEAVAGLPAVVSVLPAAIDFLA
eukprot:SM000130S27124  [mRNA]  locus=s130:369821:372958:+ [translate_table: standard]